MYPMIIASSAKEVRAARWRHPKQTWGFVPTMGALHAGHASLVRRAKKENDRVGVSIFVNPTQFNNANDLKKYPRTVKEDLALLRKAGADLIYLPDAGEVYPSDFQTYVSVEEVTKPLEGVARPGHFRGVATVVTKLFNIFSPDRAYFGQKDAQQVVVVSQMVRDLNFPLTIVVCPTLREKDGLAMSSRNSRLSPEARKAATILYKSLRAAQKTWDKGEHDAAKLKQVILDVLKTEPAATVEYVSVAHPKNLMELEGKVKEALLSMAVFVGGIRLIDNIIVG